MSDAKFRKALSQIVEWFDIAAEHAPDPTTQKNMRVQAREWGQYLHAITPTPRESSPKPE